MKYFVFLHVPYVPHSPASVALSVASRYYYYYYYYYYKCHGLECCHHTVAGALYTNLDLKLLYALSGYGDQ